MPIIDAGPAGSVVTALDTLPIITYIVDSPAGTPVGKPVADPRKKGGGDPTVEPTVRPHMTYLLPPLTLIDRVKTAWSEASAVTGGVTPARVRIRLVSTPSRGRGDAEPTGLDKTPNETNEVRPTEPVVTRVVTPMVEEISVSFI